MLVVSALQRGDKRSSDRAGMLRIFIAVVFLVFASTTFAQDTKPSQSSFVDLPTLGIEASAATNFLEKMVAFSPKPLTNGLTALTGTTGDGNIRIGFIVAETKIVAGAILIPDSSQHESAALKIAMLIRFLVNLVPEEDWNNPIQAERLGEAVARLSRDPSAGVARIIGDKYLFAVRDTRSELIRFGVMHKKMTERGAARDRFQIGNLLYSF